MNKSKNKRIIIAFRDGDAWADVKVQEDYAPRLKNELKYIYCMKEEDVEKLFKEAMESVRTKLPLGDIDVKVKLDRELEKECRRVGNHYLWDIYFPPFLNSLREEAKELRELGYKLKVDDAIALFSHLIKKWVTKARKVISDFKRDSNFDKELKGLSLLTFVSGKLKGKKGGRTLLEWLINHPEKETIKKLKDPFGQNWEKIRQSFEGLSKGKFEDLTQAEAIDVLRKKLQEFDFRLYCEINTYLMGVARNIDKPSIEVEKTKNQLEMVIEKKGVDSFSTLSRYEESRERINKLLPFLMLFHLMLRIKKGNPRQGQKIKLLVNKFREKKTWYEMLEEAEAASYNALTTSIANFRSNRLDNIRAELYQLSGGLKVEVIFKYSSKSEVKHIGIVIYDYLQNDLEPFLKTLNDFVFGQVVFFGRSKNDKISRLSQVANDFDWNHFSVTESSSSLKSELENGVKILEEQPYSILLLDSTIHGGSGNINTEHANAELELLSTMMFKDED